MLKNYLTIALRHLRRHKGYSFINIGGLAVGIACCTLIMLFVRHEWSYDRFHEKADRLFRVWVQEDYGEGRVFLNTVTPIPLGPKLVETFPEIEQAVRVNATTDLVGREPNKLTERIHLVDPAFFGVFSFPLRQGDPVTALTALNSVVLTPEVAERYFGDEDPIGRTLSIHLAGVPQDFVVTGLAEAPPAASSIQFDLLIPYARTQDLYSEDARQGWHQVFGETYVLLQEPADAAALEAKLPSLVRQVISERDRDGYILGLQPITDIHLNRELPAGLEPTSDPVYAYILSAIALLVLLIAGINFVTLSIGQSTRRAREVGIRKAVGAPRSLIMQQFWGEALLLAGLAVLCSLVLAQLLLPLFNDLAGRTLTLTFNGGTLLFLAVLLLVVGLGAGSYPAVVLSGFRPIEVLKDKLQLAGDRSLLRRGLVVVQFALSILMIISTLLIAQQLRYVQTRNLGFAKEQVVVLRTGVDLDQALPLIERFRNALQGHRDIVGLSASAFALDEGWLRAGYTATDGTWRTFNMNWTTPDYLETMRMKLVAGRGFSSDLATDSSSLIINEALVRDYGWGTPEAALGKRLPGSDFPEHQIVGVVQDFHYASLHTEIEPLVLAINPNVMLEGVSDVNVSASSRRKISLRIRPDDLPGTMALLRQTWEKVAPDLPFDYYFLDQAIDSQYRQEERLGRIAGTASALAILIACLGLFGLATLTVVRRTKEIGIRKVLGASATGITVLLSKDFLKLVVLAFVAAAPLAYLAISRWLESFAYRIEIGPGVFLLAGCLALVIALGTVSYQAVRAALADPVKALRYE